MNFLNLDYLSLFREILLKYPQLYIIDIHSIPAKQL